MKRAVLTIASGATYSAITKITHPTLKAYAKKCKADFILWEPLEAPHFEKFKMFELLEQYDRILYIDSDVLIRLDTEDLFELVPEDQIALVEEGCRIDRHGLIENFCHMQDFTTHAVDQSRYFNTGVMLVSKEHREIFAPFQRPYFNLDGLFETTYVNYRIGKLRPKVYELPEKFNWMGCFNTSNLGRTFGQFIHYAGHSSSKTLEEFIQILHEDRQEIEPTYKKPPDKIAIKIDGGLGDHISAEPAIRYIQDIYKDDDLIIVSHYPQVFAHLGIPHYQTGEDYIEDAKDRKPLWSLPTVDHPAWKVVSHALMNAYDYAALLMTRGTFPEDFPKQTKFGEQYYSTKHPKFPYSIFEKSALTDWSRVVLLHPGKGWQSKTFPGDVWESYVKVVRDLDLIPILIGKRISEEQGVVEFDTTGAIDLIDKLSLEELIGAISVAPVLISNDSAPIHIAGAFQNYIGLIATCKRPEFILPYRLSNILDRHDLFFRAKALERFRIYDKIRRKPTVTGMVTMEFATEEEIRKAVPTPAGLKEFIQSCARGFHSLPPKNF